MFPADIVERIKIESPELLGKMPDKKAARIIGVAMAQVAKTIAASEAGTLKIQGLGTFWVRNVEREKDGQKISGRKIMFAAAKPKPAKSPAKVEPADETSSEGQLFEADSIPVPEARKSRKKYGRK